MDPVLQMYYIIDEVPRKAASRIVASKYLEIKIKQENPDIVDEVSLKKVYDNNIDAWLKKLGLD